MAYCYFCSNVPARTVMKIANRLQLARELHGYSVPKGRDRFMQVQTQKGFTLIELMNVIAIPAISLMPTIPAYHDLPIRARGFSALAPIALFSGALPSTSLSK